MQNRIYFWLTIALFSVLSACQSDASNTPKTNTSTIFSDYFIRYMADNNELKAIASFSLGDTIAQAVPLKFEGGVTFHGSAMTMKNIQNKIYRYVQVREADYTGAFKFRCKYKEEVIEHTIKMTAIEDFYLKGIVSQTKGMDVVVVGRGLKEGESYVFLASDVNNKAVSFTAREPGSKLEFSFPATELAKLEAGKGQLYVVKKQTRFEKHNGRDIRAEIEYYTKPIEITIE